MTNTPQQLTVSAPGKMMISGEYAVLDGAEALVAAVDRRAFVRRRAHSDPNSAAQVSPEARAAFELASNQNGVDISVDTTSMRAGAQKLGLGSSAAAAAAAAGLAYAEQGLDLSTVAARIKTLDAALRGHRAISPQGSGADVAASVLGGFVRFRKLGDSVETHPIEWPEALRVCVVWTGQEARTSAFIARIEALRARDPGEYRARMRDLGDEADRFVSAVLAADGPAVIDSTAAYGEAMAALGQASGADIVTEVLATVARLAAQVGGAAKPSGAGGGDVALAVLPDARAEQQFVELCSERNFTIISIAWGAPGVRVELPLIEGV